MSFSSDSEGKGRNLRSYVDDMESLFDGTLDVEGERSIDLCGHFTGDYL